MTKTEIRNSLIIIGIGLALWFTPVPAGVKAQAWHLMAIFVATILGYILRPLPIGAVALVGLTVTSLSGVLTSAQVFSGFGNASIWLIIAAFLYARGFIKTGLGRRLAYTMVKVFGDSTLKLAYTFVLSDTIDHLWFMGSDARLDGEVCSNVKLPAWGFGDGRTARLLQMTREILKG